MDLQTLLSKSSKRLNHPDLHPKVKAVAEKLIELAFAKGIYVVIVQAVRTMEEQAEIYAKGRTKPGRIVSMARSGYSPHNYGLAVDYVLLEPDGRTVHWDVSADFNNDHQKDWFQVSAIAKQLGFEWGGEWDSFKDYPHLQMMFGLTIADLRRGKRPPKVSIQLASEEEEDMKPFISKEEAETLILLLKEEWTEETCPEKKKRIGKIADILRIASGQKPQNV